MKKLVSQILFGVTLTLLSGCGPDDFGLRITSPTPPPVIPKVELFNAKSLVHAQLALGVFMDHKRQFQTALSVFESDRPNSERKNCPSISTVTAYTVNSTNRIRLENEDTEEELEVSDENTLLQTKGFKFSLSWDRKKCHMGKGKRKISWYGDEFFKIEIAPQLSLQEALQTESFKAIEVSSANMKVQYKSAYNQYRNLTYGYKLKIRPTSTKNHFAFVGKSDVLGTPYPVGKDRKRYDAWAPDVSGIFTTYPEKNKITASNIELLTAFTSLILVKNKESHRKEIILNFESVNTNNSRISFSKCNAPMGDFEVTSYFSPREFKEIKSAQLKSSAETLKISISEKSLISWDLCNPYGFSFLRTLFQSNHTHDQNRRGKLVYAPPKKDS